MSSISHFESRSISCLFHEAIELNNNGVDFFKLGHYENAIQFLYGALSRMQRFSKFKDVEQSRFEQHIVTESMSVSRAEHTHTHNSAMMEPTSNHHPHHHHHHHHQHHHNGAGQYEQRSQSVQHSHALQGEPSRHGNGGSTTFNNEDDIQCISSLPLLSVASSGRDSSECGRECTNCTTNTNEDNSCIIHATTIDITAIYRCAVNLACHGDCTEAIANPAFSCSRWDVARIRASILFNLGLAHHMLAGVASTSSVVPVPHTIPFAGAGAGAGAAGAPSFASNPADEDIARMIEKAKVFYQLSLNLQESEQAPISTNYVMALCNNIGQCYAGLNRKSESITWIERLLRLLVCQQQQQQQQQQLDQRYQPLNECFVRNTASLILTDPYIAPMA